MTKTSQAQAIYTLPSESALQWAKIVWYLNRQNKRRWRNK